jgi:hypothetical protein
LNPLLALQPRRGSREELELLRERLGSMGFRPDASRVATPPPAPFVPPTIGPRREGLPFAPERAPARGISVDFGDGGGERALNMDMLEGVASLSSAPSRGAGKALKALADKALPRLSALHNTSPEKLKQSLDLGGFPVPSVAVVPEHVPFTDFGEITLVGKRSLGDPATSRVYSADAYTSRVPERLLPKLTKWQISDIWQQVTGGESRLLGDPAFKALEDGDLDRIIQNAYRSPAIRRAAGLDRPLSPDDYGQLDEFVASKFEPLIGRAQVQVGKQRWPYTLDNVAEAMSRKGRLTEGKEWAGSLWSSGQLRAANADIFRNLEQMRRRAATDVRLDSDADRSATEDLVKAVRNLSEAASSPVEDVLRAVRSKGGLERNLAREGLKDVPPNALESLAKALDNFKRAPVKYFEAKPQRGVRFDEFAGAVVPQHADASLVERLRNAGLKVEQYDPWGTILPRRAATVEQLRRLLNEQGGNTLFSLGALGAGLGAATPSRSRQDNR